LYENKLLTYCTYWSNCFNKPLPGNRRGNRRGRAAKLRAAPPPQICSCATQRRLGVASR
jgi:hypothetical protein